LGIKVGEKVLFANSDLFDQTQEFLTSKPIDLSK